MAKQLVIFIFFILSSAMVNAQKKELIDCNSIFVGLDSATYRDLFSSAYLKDTLFICRQNATQTNKENYEGKYLIGESATIEFFCEKPLGKLGDKVGDIGIELKTRSTNQIVGLFAEAKKLKIPIDTATIYNQDGETSIIWYKTISLAGGDQNLGLSTLEYQADYLKYLGFNDDEILSPMTFKQFNSKLSAGKPYPRLFSSIKSISMSASNQQIKKMKSFCLLNNFYNKPKKSSNGTFDMIYQSDDHLQTVKLKAIEINLLREQAKRTLIISKTLKIIVDGKMATLFFN